MKKILLPTNFSEQASHAARYAIRLFQQESTRFMLLNAYNLSLRPTEIRISALQGGIGATAKKALIEIQHQLSKEIRQYGASITGTTVFGEPSRVVRNFARAHQVDALVLGRGSQVAQRGFFISDPVRELIRKAGCPVMVVPEATQFCEPGQILLLSDLHAPTDPQRMQTLLSIANQYQAKVTVVCMVNKLTLDRAELKLGELKKVLGESLHDFYFLNDHQLSEGLQKLMKQQTTELVAVQGRSAFISQLYKTWTSGRTRAFSARPLLAVRT